VVKLEDKTMSRICAICDKGRMSGNNVSHSNRKTRRSFAPNLQKVKIVQNGSQTAALVCTKCLKTGKVQRV